MDFDEFAGRYVGDLIRLGMAMTGSQSDAEDFAQAALERIFSQWGKVESAENSWAYARRVAVNAFLASRRRPQVREVLGSASSRSEPASDPIDATWGDGSLDAAISRLPKQQRAAVVLRYFEDLDARGVAEVLGVEPATVRGYLTRALATIRSECYPTANGAS